MLVSSTEKYNFLHYFLSWYTEELELQGEIELKEGKKEFKCILKLLKRNPFSIFLFLSEGFMLVRWLYPY